MPRPKGKRVDEGFEATRQAWRKELESAGLPDRPSWELPGPKNTAVVLHAVYLWDRPLPSGMNMAALMYVQFYEGGGMAKFIQWNGEMSDLWADLADVNDMLKAKAIINTSTTRNIGDD